MKYYKNINLAKPFIYKDLTKFFFCLDKQISFIFDKVTT
ncbi:hypothetical protein CU016_2259 [Enterococcus lactis]|nr:hypothetical protein [Enterococcus lactis]MBL5015493.1 hypothetical protein [Enterococcus lactis]